MFYAHIILAKKGPLARIWLAAHWDKKITKAHVFETNIEKSVEGIMQPKVKLALRTSGHLLLGVVRIYSRKAKYLLADCNEAFVKIKMAFRPGMVDLPEGHREANVNTITLPEVFHDFDTALPELNDIDIEAQFSINQSRADEITLREDYGSLPLSLNDDGFGDMGFDGDTPDMLREQLKDNLNDQLFEEELVTDDRVNMHPVDVNEADLANSHLDGDGFGEEFGQPELFDDDLFGEPPRLEKSKSDEIAPNVNEDTEDGSDHFLAHASSPNSSCHESITAGRNDDPNKVDNTNLNEFHKDDDETNEQNNLNTNKDESFALAPIDASAYKGLTKTKRKRKLIVDEVKNISGEEMKAQLANTSDIVTTLDLAPPTKRLMYWKETGGIEKLFSLPSRSIPARALFINYQRHLISHITPLEDFTVLGPADILALDHISNENDASILINSKRGRKRKVDALTNNNLLQTGNEASVSLIGNSLNAPEAVRDQDFNNTSEYSLNINMNERQSLVIGGENLHTENSSSPGQLFGMSDVNVMDNLSSAADMPFAAAAAATAAGGSLVQHHGADVSDDNHGDITPAHLHHGQITPRHPDIETIESIPNLPVDQVSSILNEAENMSQLGSNHLANKPCSLVSDWNDYPFANYMELENNYDEQLENETNEQFEERVLNKRAAQFFYAVRARMSKHDCLIFSELIIRNSRKQAAQKFYSLLVLKKARALNIVQSSPYSDITVSRGPLFDNPAL